MERKQPRINRKTIWRWVGMGKWQENAWESIGDKRQMTRDGQMIGRQWEQQQNERKKKN